MGELEENAPKLRALIDAVNKEGNRYASVLLPHRTHGLSLRSLQPHGGGPAWDATLRRAGPVAHRGGGR